MYWRGGEQQAAVVRHEELAKSRDVVLLLLLSELPGKNLAQVLKHYEEGPATPTVLFAECGYQRIDDLRVVFLGLYRGEQIRPPWFIIEDLLQYLAHAD